VTPARWQDYGPLETTTAPAGLYAGFDDEASPAQALHRAQVLHRAQAVASEVPPPRPKVVDCVVFADTTTRTLSVRPGDQVGGYEKAIWREAWQSQRRAQESGWPLSGSRWIYADVPGAPRVVHGVPVDGGQMAFHFPVGTAGFGTLIAKPGLVALVSLDISTREFLTCRFLNLPG
jgi:hypothetical protein